MDTQTQTFAPATASSLQSVLRDSRMRHNNMTAISSAALHDMEQWLRQATRPALGTSLLTPEQRKLSQCLMLITRSKRLVEAIELAGATV